MAQTAVQPLPTLAHGANEPAFSAGLRQAAWGKYLELPLPKNDEHWRRTDLRSLQLDALPAYTPGVVGQIPAEVAHLIPTDAAVLVQHNSTVVSVHLPQELAAQGVILASLVEAAESYPELVEPYLMRGGFDPAENKLTALHGAKWTGGFFLYVPRNVELTVPIWHVIWVDAPGAAVHTHSLVVADAHSRVSVAAWRGSVGAGLCTEAVEVCPQDGANVAYSCLQAWGPDTNAFHFRRARPGRDAQIKWSVADFGGQLVRSEVETAAVGEGSQSDIVTAFYASAGQHLDLLASAVHTGSHSRSNILSKGAVGAHGRVVYRGRGEIEAGAKQASCYQREQALILEDDARHDAIPSLYIHETDVAGAGHAATSGRVDELQLFYLQSRGISAEVAKRMVVEGFMAQVMAGFPCALRVEMQALLDRKLRT